MNTQIFNKVEEPIEEENTELNPSQSEQEEDFPVPTADAINSDPIIEEANSAVNDNDDDYEEQPKKGKKGGPSRFILGLYDWVSAFLFALVVVILVITFGVRMVDVDGSSMMNTLQDHDKVFITGLNYEPQVGDIVVISHGAELDKTLVKRIIAVGGQTVDIDFDTGDVMVDGVVLDEPYILGSTQVEGGTEFPLTVTDGTVFVLGDNRPISNDSRYPEVGLINVDDIIGKVQFRIYPFSSIGRVE